MVRRCLCLGALLVSLSGFCNEDRSELTRLLSKIDSLEGQFTQIAKSSNGEVLTTYRGVVRLRRPFDFWWEIQEPYTLYYKLIKDQIIEFDPDLEQVTYRQLAQFNEIPIVSLLVHGDQAVLEEFTIEKKRHFFVLKPKSETALFESIEVYFEGQLLDAIDIRDRNEDVTEFTFNIERVNPVLKDSDFELTIPPNIDVIGSPPEKLSDPAL